MIAAGLILLKSLFVTSPAFHAPESAVDVYSSYNSPIIQIESRAMNALPPAIRQAVDAINSADTDSFVSAFATDGLINDWGRVLRGHEGVRSWARTDAIGAGAQITVTESSIEGETTHIRFDWKSRVFNGQSQAFVTVKDGLISEFRIPSH